MSSACFALVACAVCLTKRSSCSCRSLSLHGLVRWRGIGDANVLRCCCLIVNKQINDKERVSAAMENPNLFEIVEECLRDAQ